MKRFLLVTLVSLVTLAGCHSFKKENVQPPTPLAKDFKPTVQVTRLWRTSVGDGATLLASSASATSSWGSTSW